MSRYRFELATPADDADLRSILARTPMDGPISVSFRREPSYFGAAEVDGQFRQVVAARDLATGRLVGFGSRSVRNVYVNGRPDSIGYLSSLRLLAEHRNLGLVAKGYARFRRLHQDGRTLLYLTTIAEGNQRAIDQLTSGRAGLPVYHPAGDYLTLAIPAGQRGPLASLSHARGVEPRNAPPNGDRPAPLEVRPATPADRHAVMEVVNRLGPRRQFFPVIAEQDLFADHGLYRGLRPGDLLLAFRGGRLVGMVGAWDQQPFRQTVIEGYRGPLRWARPLINGWSRIVGRPPLPPAGAPLRAAYAALAVLENEDSQVLAPLVQAAAARAADRADYLLLGLAAADPLLESVRRLAVAEYVTHLFLVGWEDSDALRMALDGRPPYLELGSL
jgi:hypothetical protein